MNEPTSLCSPGITERHDVVVVGARCAGSATGMLLARLGHDVVIVDRATFPSDTLSTHVIARAGVVQLHRWGLLDAVLDSGAPPLRTVEFSRNGVTVERAIADHAGVDLLVAPRRYMLDEILVEAARSDGADVRTGFTVHDVVRTPDGRVDGIVGEDDAGARRTIRARIVIGADGLRSRISRAVGSTVTHERHHNGAVHYAYYAGVGRGSLEQHFSEGAFAGVFPTHHGEANVWCAGPVGSTPTLGAGEQRGERFEALVARDFPQLAWRLARGRRTSPVRGFVGMPNRIRRATGPGWALVGDASYFRDATTGHGISDAFRDAEELSRGVDLALRVPAVEAEALARYEQVRDRAIAELFDVTCRLALYPPMSEFIALQRRLTELVDAESVRLASTPPIPHLGAAVA
jgi:flavin-dependent dehydrogenase